MKKIKSSELSLNINSVEKLLTYLQLDINKIDYSKNANDSFSFTVPDSFVKRIKKSDANDPLLLQILPQKKELIEIKGFSFDPLDEKHVLLAPGLLQKYQHRVLLIATSSCGIHCRYCFRRHFPYSREAYSKESYNKETGKSLLSQQLENNIQLIKSKTDITEVILSGGDPLTLNDQRLDLLLEKLSHIPHLKRLRIHSRQLIVQPQRITKQLVTILKKFPHPVTIVMHINHPAEINDEVTQSISHLKQANIQLLNQSVLLKNVNDQSEVLISLSESLYQAGILPYYLHMLDAVSGSQHFNVSNQKAKKIITEMKKKLPGYLVPKLVKEYPDDEYKREL
ncbi:MAG: EF-P beta-lysylation protein EpmB [Pseudomonadota bacterium]